MKIRVEPIEMEGAVLILCDDQVAAKDDQTIQGCRWEAPGDMDVAYAIVSDYPELIGELKQEGYKVDARKYNRRKSP